MGAAANIGFSRKDFPIYCTHCASSNRNQFEGGPLVFVIDGLAQKDPASPMCALPVQERRKAGGALRDPFPDREVESGTVEAAAVTKGPFRLPTPDETLTLTLE